MRKIVLMLAAALALVSCNSELRSARACAKAPEPVAERHMEPCGDFVPEGVLAGFVPQSDLQ